MFLIYLRSLKVNQNDKLGIYTEINEHQALTAHIIKCGLGADNQHFHPLLFGAFRQESAPQSAPNHIREPLCNIQKNHS